MSELKVTTLKHADSAVDSIVMASDGTLAFGSAVTDSAGVAVKGGVPAQAWVNFNGQGTVAIRASFNVSSITDNAVGDYSVNFTTAMVDANYALGGSTQLDLNSANNVGNSALSISRFAALTAGSCRVVCVGGDGNVRDHLVVAVSIFS